MVKIISLCLLFLCSGNAIARVIEVAPAEETAVKKDAHDPTAPLGWKKSPTSSATGAAKKGVVYTPALQSILCDDAQCHAIIDGKILKQGQSIRGYKVKSINSQKVVLTRGSKVWNLELFSQIIKN